MNYCQVCDSNFHQASLAGHQRTPQFNDPEARLQMQNLTNNLNAADVQMANDEKEITRQVMEEMEREEKAIQQMMTAKVIQSGQASCPEEMEILMQKALAANARKR